MGLWASKVVAPKGRVMVLGLDAAGKSTMLYGLSDKVKTEIPTIGMNLERLKLDHGELLALDLGGRSPSFKTAMIRSMKLLENVDAVMFVIDACDSDRLDTAVDELNGVARMLDERGADVPFAVVLNKTDLPLAASSAELEEKIGQEERWRKRRWQIFRTVATQKAGVADVLAWLTAQCA